MVKNFLAALAVAAVSISALGRPLSGTYERVPATKRESGTLVVSELSSGMVVVNLEVEFNPDPSDGLYGSGITRNGGLERHAIPLNGNVALFQAPKEGDPPCSIVFVFGSAEVNVTQFGECSWFGAGVNATGRYVRLGPAAPAAPDHGCTNADSGRYSDISLCGKSQSEKVDAELNKTYNQLLDVLRDDLPRRKLLVESQRAWLVYRDKSCEFWTGVLSYQFSWCRFGITDHRLTDLDHMHACLVEGAGEC
jgi:uncharacterized protein YecT (DUF1311 family)